MELESLFNGLQAFKRYVQQNMPFKLTTFKTTDDPTVGDGYAAPIGSELTRLDGDGKLLEIYRKVGNTNLEWDKTYPVELPENIGSLTKIGEINNLEMWGDSGSGSELQSTIVKMDFYGSYIDENKRLIKIIFYPELDAGGGPLRIFGDPEAPIVYGEIYDTSFLAEDFRPTPNNYIEKETFYSGSYETLNGDSYASVAVCAFFFGDDYVGVNVYRDSPPTASWDFTAPNNWSLEFVLDLSI